MRGGPTSGITLAVRIFQMHIARERTQVLRITAGPNTTHVVDFPTFGDFVRGVVRAKDEPVKHLNFSVAVAFPFLAEIAIWVGAVTGTDEAGRVEAKLQLHEGKRRY
jgi:hypothetical protein